MATINVNFNAVDGPEQSFNIYELDWAGLTALPTYTSSRDVTIDMQGIDGQVHYVTFDSSGTNLSSLISQVPIDTPGDPNDLCNFDPKHTYADGDYRLDYIYQDDHVTLNTDIVGWVQLGVKPDDWGSNPHYFTLEDVYSSADDTRVMAAVPQSIEFEWNPLTQYYRDKSEKMVRILYLKNGYSFSCSKGMLEYHQDLGRTYYGSASIGCTRFSGPYLQSSPQDHYQKHYTLTYGSDITTYAAPTTGSFPYFASIHIAPANGGDYIPFQFFFHTTIADKDHYGVLLVITNRFTNNIVSIRGTMISDNFWAANINPQNQSWWGNDGPSSIHQGGQGTFDAPSDNDGNRDGTSVQTQVNFFNTANNYLEDGYHFYVMRQGETAAFTEMMAQLWDPTFWESYRNLVQNPLNAIISCYSIPEKLAPIKSQTTKKIQAAGAVLSESNAPTFYDTMKWVHIGSVDVSSYTDSFADYTATNVYINLPYVGNYKLDTEALMEGTIGVDYVVDAYTGDITARVWTEDRFGNHKYKYEFKGNCAKQIPLASIVGQGFTAVKSAAESLLPFLMQGGLQAMVDMASNAPSYYSSGGSGFGGLLWTAEETVPGFKANSAGTMLGSGLMKTINASSQITQSNASGGTVTSLVEDQCFLTITRPQWSAPANYRKLFGYPSDCGGTIDEKFHGFLSVRSIRLESVPATPEEKAEIDQLMRAGVFVDNIFEPEE